MRNNNTSGNKRIKIMIAVLTAACILTFTGCSTYSSFSQTFINKPESVTEPAFTIGVIEPQSGKNAERGKAEIKGIELANSIYNNVDGYKVNLVKVDTQSTVGATETAIQALIEMKPVAIIGSCGDASSLAITDYIDDAQIPTITPSATNPLITQNSAYYFRACLTESQMGEGLAEYAYNALGSTKIGVVSIKNDTSTSALLDGFYSKIRELAGKKSKAIAASAEITSDEEEMKKALRDIRSAGVDVCFVSMGAEEMDTFFTNAEAMGLKGVTFLGTKSWGDEAFISMMSKHNGIKVVFPYETVLSKPGDSEDSQSEEGQKFRIEYASRYGDADIPTDNAALGYDSYLLLINAIHNAKSLEGPAIREAIWNFDGLKCATGVFSFDKTGNVVRSVTLATIRDGKAVLEYTTDSEAQAKRLEEIENEGVGSNQ